MKKSIFIIVMSLAILAILVPLYMKAGIEGLTTLNDAGVLITLWGSGWVTRIAMFALIAGGLALTGFWEMLSNKLNADKQKKDSSN